jgi:spore coat polysaccharide biosynthesis protein SpsF (cytidylyltransferase family)
MIIVQARMGGTRLPGKVLKKINGKILLHYLTDRVSRAQAPFWIAWAHYYTGIHESDVAGRFRNVLLQEVGRPAWFVRVCADSPLLDPALINAAIALFKATGAKIVNNQRYPHGQQVEVIDTQYFLEREPLMTGTGDREHVTTYLYRNAKPGEWVEFFCNRDMRFDVSLAVDTQQDFERMERVIKRMDRPHTEYGWQECMQLAWEEANG